MLCLSVLTTTVAARCRPEGPPVTKDMVDTFISKPTVLLLDATSKRDADAMATSVSQYVAADASAMPALMSVLPQASVDQRIAIGRGLFRVVDVCGAVDQAVVQRTETAVQKISDATVLTAYRTAEGATTRPTTPAPSGDPRGRPGLLATGAIIGGPALNDPMNLKLSDPFILPEIR